ncbi:MAG: hypothetical protein ACE366_17405 [Bradymonadia bacterium]
MGRLSHAVIQALGPLSLNRDVLTRELEQAGRFKAFGGHEKSRAHLSKTLNEVYADLSFQPQLESILPTQYPAMAPVGEIIIRRHGAYRLASTQTRFAGGDLEREGLLSLVQHAARHRLPLTMPVVTRYTGNQNRPSSKASLAVMYAPTENLPLGMQGNISVFVVPPARVVAMGMRGDSLMEVARRCGPWLDRWFERHADRYVADGPLRVLTYNPSVSRDRRSRYFELERPIRPAGEASGFDPMDEMSLDGVW